MTKSSGRIGSRSKPHLLLSTRGCSASAWTLSAANITTGTADHESGSACPRQLAAGNIPARVLEPLVGQVGVVAR
jgi:hypothetical protein